MKTLCDNLKKLYGVAKVRAAAYGGVRLEHVHSHLGDDGNERADKNADSGVTRTNRAGRYDVNYPHHASDQKNLENVTLPPNPGLDLNESY